ncbi:MAG: hypothetical protein AAGB13_17485 [Cyanobacteria bacterium P01_F01_bin.33]
MDSQLFEEWRDLMESMLAIVSTAELDSIQSEAVDKTTQFNECAISTEELEEARVSFWKQTESIRKNDPKAYKLCRAMICIMYPFQSKVVKNLSEFMMDVTEFFRDFALEGGIAEEVVATLKAYEYGGT